MNKRFLTYFLIWLVVLAVFNVICFVVPESVTEAAKDSGMFWLAYIVMTVAFIGHLVCVYFVLGEKDNRKLVYKLPIAAISGGGLLIMAIASVICVLVPAIPLWLGIIICVLIFAITLIAVITASGAAGTVSAIDQKVKAKQLFVRVLTAQAETEISMAEDPEIKSECKRVYEAIRYSDPMSDNALAQIENDINSMFNEFRQTVSSGNKAAVKQQADTLIRMIGDRNTRCKLLK